MVIACKRNGARSSPGFVGSDNRALKLTLLWQGGTGLRCNIVVYYRMSRSEETAGTDGSGRAKYPLLGGSWARQDLVTGAVLWRSSRLLHRKKPTSPNRAKSQSNRTGLVWRLVENSTVLQQWHQVVIDIT
jgi:hypothetical protein